MKKLLVLITITCVGLTTNAQYYLGLKAGGGLSGLTTNGRMPISMELTSLRVYHTK